MAELTRLLMRRRTAAEWTALNESRMDGELGIITDVSPRKMKIGDGITSWQSLPLMIDTSSLTSGFGNATPATPVDPTINTVNVDIAGIYTLRNGIVVSVADLASGLVQLRLENGVWAKVIVPIDLTRFVTLTQLSAYLLTADLATALGNIGLSLTQVGGAFLITDTQGNIAFRINVDGTVDIPLLNNSGGYVLTQTNDAIFAILDTNNSPAFIIRNDFTIVSPTIIDIYSKITALTTRVSNIESGIASTTQSLGNYGPPKSLLMTMIYGQSLAKGTNALPVISTTQSYNSVMFSGGVEPLILECLIH